MRILLNAPYDARIHVFPERIRLTILRYVPTFLSVETKSGIRPNMRLAHICCYDHLSPSYDARHTGFSRFNASYPKTCRHHCAQHYHPQFGRAHEYLDRRDRGLTDMFVYVGGPFPARYFPHNPIP